MEEEDAGEDVEGLEDLDQAEQVESCPARRGSTCKKLTCMHPLVRVIP